MKRALSLIIVLAMVLCMIPFSAFAADFDVATDFVDGVITLPASGEVSYLWTATEDGTLEIYAEPVLPEVAEGEEASADVKPYILVDGAEYTAPIAVKDGESYEIAFVDNAMIGGDVTVYTVFKGLPGTETNPYEMYNPATGMGDGNNTTVSVEPGASVYYTLYYYANTIVKISGAGVEVVKGEETVDGTEAGYVEFNFAPNDRNVTIKITNKDAAAQTYTIEGIVPVGTMDNPKVVTAGEYQAELAAGNQGYYYTYIAEGDGTVNVNVSAQDAEGNTLGTMLCVNNLTSYIYGDQTTDGFWSVAVSAGDEIQIMAATFNEADMWNAPAGTVTTSIEFVAAEEPPVEPSTIVIESLPYTTVEYVNTYEQMYNYTATENGYLFVSATNDGFFELNIGGTTWAEPYNGGFVLPMNAGDVANLNVYAYWGEGTYTYTAEWLTEIVPDGSYGYPFVVDTLLNGDVTLTNDGENAVYYAYTAEKDGKISNSFTGESIDVVTGEVVSFYVPAGGITVGYVPPVATLNGVEYYSVAAALAEAVSGDTVVMVNDSHEENVNLIIDDGVTLNIGTNNLYVKGIIAFAGGKLAITEYRKSLAYGSLYVSSDARLVLTDSVVLSDGSTSTVNLMPAWDSANNRYVFAGMMLQKGKYTASMTDTDINFKFQLAYRGDAKNAFFLDGIQDNGLKIAIRLTWKSGDHVAQQDFFYSDDFAKQLANANGYFTFALSGYPAMYINKADLTITPMVVSDTGVEFMGVTVYGTEL